MLMKVGSYGAAYGIIADITTVGERGSFVGSLILLYVALTIISTCPYER